MATSAALALSVSMMRLDQQQVDAAVDQPARLLAKASRISSNVMRGTPGC